MVLNIVSNHIVYDAKYCYSDHIDDANMMQKIELLMKLIVVFKNIY